MKKFTLMFVALVAFAWSANAQVVEGGVNYVSETAQAADYVIQGTTMPYYAKPDTYYHPGYATPTWALATGFTWTWDLSDAGVNEYVGVALPNTPAVKPANYVELTFTAAAGNTVTFSVKEIAPAAVGACPGASSSHTVTVIEKPDFGAIVNTDIEICNGGSAALTGSVDVPFTLNTNDSKIHLWFSIKAYNYDWDGASSWTNETAIADPVQTTVAVGAQIITSDEATPKHTINLAQTSTGVNYQVVNSKRTVYKLFVNGFSSAISRKCDYLSVTGNTDWANFSNMLATPKEVASIAVNIAPATGEIYHITNAWAVN